MLGQHYRFTAYNATGQTLAANAITIKPRPAESCGWGGMSNDLLAEWISKVGV